MDSIKIRYKNNNYILSKSYIKKLKNRLLKNRKINLLTGCWEWTGTCANNGYGQIGITFKYKKHSMFSVHRISAILFLKFSNDPKLCVCHTCDNKKCFNPKHLFIGTQSDNMIDASNKKRINGSKKSISKLTEEQVKNIRKEGEFCNWKIGINQTLANKYRVNHRTISAIKNNIIWKHV